MRLYFLLLIFVLCWQSGHSQDLVEFRGIGRSGIYDESNLLKSWPKNGPELLLKIHGVGKGYSQPISCQNKIFITGIKQDTMDALSCYDLNGKKLWETVYGRSWIRTYPESRSTPTYADGKLYVVSGTGQVGCIDSSNGKLIWTVNASEKYKGEIFKHGEAESPLVYKDKVFYTTGGEENTMVALDKNTGSLVWKAESLGGEKSYASPILINHNGQDIILAQTSKNLIALRADNGDILWHYDLIQYHTNSQGIGAQANPPIYYKSEIFVTSGYDHPGILFSISEDGKSVSEKWKNNSIDTHIGGVVMVDGNLYGSNWQNNSQGKWTSVNWETGKTNWETDWFNKGSVIYADGMLYLFEEKSGNVALVKPGPERLNIVSTFRAKEGDGPYWAHPAIYDGKLFIRHGDVLLVYNIKNS